MNIIKRDRSQEVYDKNKIKRAIEGAFMSVSSVIYDDVLQDMVENIEYELKITEKCENLVHVEMIQDQVEKELMRQGYYNEMRSYILYREEHAFVRKARQDIEGMFQTYAVKSMLKGLQKRFPQSQYSFQILFNKLMSFQKAKMDDQDQLDALMKAAVELTSQEAPKWEYIAATIKMFDFYRKLKIEERSRGIHNFYDKLCYLTNKGLYGSYILDAYSKEEVTLLEGIIDVEKDDLLTYSSVDLLLKRYVIHTTDKIPLESPQEMFLGIAMHLAMKEEDKIVWVRRFYDMLSSWKVTMATPTMSNARKPFHQLSSCFIDTVGDSLDGIYRSIDNFAKVSKLGGGMGLYFGKVRAQGSSIRGFKGAAGGVIRWIKLVNDTAVAVDQLGVRQGAVAVYLDAWHRDIPEFLQLRTNNGDDRMKAHDVFPAICYPNLFWKKAKEDIDGMWYMMCPHEIRQIKGYALEDKYGEEWERCYLDCVQDDRISKREIRMKELIRLILKSAVETGTPFTFNRDLVNDMNPNGHKGMIYCSNLCTEIAQNMSEISFVKQEIVTKDKDVVIIETTRPGDFVVCNLASLVLGNINVNDYDELEKIVSYAVRALDNVIDLNFYPVPYAQITNQKYRAIGLGISGYHHMLANNGISWESDEHIECINKVFEDINYLAIRTSHQLASIRGSYDEFQGSDWQTGAYFKKRNYQSDKWNDLQVSVSKKGLRNGYIMAIAPTSSTSILAGTTAGIDPIMQRFFLEEKKGSIMPRVAPDLQMSNFWLYKHAHQIDQSWSVKAAGVRQRHIDQAQSMNLYITNDNTMRQILDLYIQAWEHGVKTIYYIRSKSLEVEECTTCSA